MIQCVSQCRSSDNNQNSLSRVEQTQNFCIIFLIKLVVLTQRAKKKEKEMASNCSRAVVNF